jgi:hypothetical protein
MKLLRRSCLHLLPQLSFLSSKQLLSQILSILYFLRLLKTQNNSFRMPLNTTAMSIWSSSSSDTSSEIYSIRYHTAQATAPSLENIEKLLQQEATIQAEISAQLSAVSAAVDKDIQVTKKCVYFRDPSSMPSSMWIALVAQKHNLQSRQNLAIRSSTILKLYGAPINKSMNDLSSSTQKRKPYANVSLPRSVS